MYLSKLVIDPLRPAAYRVLGSPYLLHQAVMAGFDPQARGDSRVLFRLEPERWRGRVVVLVQSQILPRWERCLDRFFGDAADAETKPFSLALRPGQRLRLRLRANPTRKLRVEGRRNGKRAGVYGEEALRQWLEGKLNGSRLTGVVVVDEGLVVDRAHGLQLQSAFYEGTLEVLDPDLLLAAVASGLGSAKAFGFGLLSLAPAGAER